MLSIQARFVGALLMLSLISIGCQSASNGGGTPGPDLIDLEGLWLVTPGPGSFYGAGGTTTVEFGSAASGSAQFLSQADDNDITTCERHVYAALSENVVMLDETFYVAEQPNADRIVLDNDTNSITLDRVSGADPVEPCEEAATTEINAFDFGTGSFTGLNAVGSRLYFNMDDSGSSIIAYNTATGTLGAPRTYSISVSGGTHRWVMAARTDDLFYGQCGCGGSMSANYFNLGTNTSIASVESETDLGVGVSFRYGYFDGSNPVLGGRDRNTFEKNVLLTLDPDTLALVSQREILEGAFVSDLTLRGSDLLALVGRSLVVVGVDGRADRTIDVSGLSSSPRGVAAIGDDVYILDEGATGDAVLVEVSMP